MQWWVEWSYMQLQPANGHSKRGCGHNDADHCDNFAVRSACAEAWRGATRIRGRYRDGVSCRRRILALPAEEKSRLAADDSDRFRAARVCSCRMRRLKLKFKFEPATADSNLFDYGDCDGRIPVSNSSIQPYSVAIASRAARDLALRLMASNRRESCISQAQLRASIQGVIAAFQGRCARIRRDFVLGVGWLRYP